jgi:hypothetical protein
VRSVLADAPFDVLDCTHLPPLCARLRLQGFTNTMIAQLLLGELLKEQNAALWRDNYHYRRRYGADLPHIAAAATMMGAGANRLIGGPPCSP